MASGSRPPHHVVVGGGTAGCMLVNRLLVLGHDVTLVERTDGPGDSDCYQQASMWGEQLYSEGNPHLHRHYSVRQAHLYSRRIYLPQGRGIGGTSNLNAMMLTLGSREAYKDWPAESCFCAAGLGATMEGPVAAAVRPTRMHSAFNIVSHLMSSSSSSSSRDSSFFYEGPAAWGYWSSTRAADGLPNATRADMPSLLTPQGGAGGSLRVVRGTVGDILVERGRAQGVMLRMEEGGVRTELRAARGGEVVLCAGAVGSFELLSRLRCGSGAVTARRFESRIVDHVALPVVFVGRWWGDWGGSAAAGPSTGVHGWLNLSAQGAPTEGLPAAQLLFIDGRGAAAHLPALLLPDIAGEGWSVRMYRLAVYRPLRSLLAVLARLWLVQWLCGFVVVAMVCLVQPKSTGSITLTVAEDGSSTVAVDPQYLSDPRDLATLRSAHASASRIVKRRYGWSLWQLLPGPLGFDTYARLLATTYYHLCGSCPMPYQGSEGVVDERLRVRGYSGLRIADASVLPAAPTGPPAALCLCVGAACAQLLAEDCPWRRADG